MSYVTANRRQLSRVYSRSREDIIAAQDIIYRDRFSGSINFNKNIRNFIINFDISKRITSDPASGMVIGTCTIPTAAWYDADASRLFGLADYSSQISDDMNEVAHNQGRHIIVEVKYEDLNPFNTKVDDSYRYTYYVSNILSTAVISDRELCNVASI